MRDNSQSVLKFLIKQHNFTKDYLAEKLCIEPRQLSKLETGINYPSFETIVGLLDTFGITFEELTNFGHLKENTNVKSKMIDELNKLDNEKIRYLYKITRNVFN